MGKVFFNFPGGQPGSCTGTVVDSPSGRVVIAAAHCVEHGGPGGEWFTNFAFVPAFENGEEPLGLFTVADVATDGLWAGDADETHDYGVLVVNDDAEGETVADVAGALPLRTTPSATANVHITGYPAAGGYDGKNQEHCEDLTEPTLPPRKLIWVNCPTMEQGASGGPWLHGFDATTQEGEIYGVNTILDDLGNIYTPPVRQQDAPDGRHHGHGGRSHVTAFVRAVGRGVEHHGGTTAQGAPASVQAGGPGAPAPRERPPLLDPGADGRHPGCPLPGARALRPA
ncbi:hypothetical protein [Streptomyces sp. CC208A]|uniref:trypsin-like serine peptidase n=1 Tax=Streptomyces sp. CC208A TaxID=3044573 RepID=UPI0024A9261F|nr:hypothetical protein [Streptomyces sp. CC208A]